MRRRCRPVRSEPYLVSGLASSWRSRGKEGVMATNGQEVIVGDGEQEASTSPETCLGTSTAPQLYPLQRLPTDAGCFSGR
jgi:hypothetical protein